MPLRQCMESHTERELRGWLSWIVMNKERDAENPSPDQWYMMQIAQEIKRVLSKNPASIKLSNFKLSFKKPKPLSPEQVKSRWFGLVGYKGSTDGVNNGSRQPDS